MPILRKQKHSGFTTVNNYFINDINLKPEGKGFLLFMLSKPDDWHFNYVNFQKSLGIGEKAIRSNLKKLEELKYLKRERIRDKSGHYDWNYYVYEEPHNLIIDKENLPYIPRGYMDEGDIVEGNIYQNTELSNTDITNDKKDNKDKIDKGISSSNKNMHNILTIELIQLNYVKEDDPQTFYYDDLFASYLNNGKSYKQLYSSIHYIVSRIQIRNYIDENGDEISNKYGYLKSALDSNFNKFEMSSDKIYSEDNQIESDNWLEWR